MTDSEGAPDGETAAEIKTALNSILDLMLMKCRCLS